MGVLGCGQMPALLSQHGHWGQRPRAGLSLLHGESCRTRMVGGMADRRWGGQSPRALQAKGRTLAFLQNELGATAGCWAEGWHLLTSILESKGTVSTKVLSAPAGTWGQSPETCHAGGGKKASDQVGSSARGRAVGVWLSVCGGSPGCPGG